MLLLTEPLTIMLSVRIERRRRQAWVIDWAGFCLINTARAAHESTMTMLLEAQFLLHFQPSLPPTPAWITGTPQII